MIVKMIYNKNTSEVFIDGIRLDPGPSQRLRNHSPDGFSVGYNGSGPSQLALAILLKCYGQDTAERFYKIFREEIIAQMPRDTNFTVEIDLGVWLDDKDPARTTLFRKQT